MQNTKNRSWLLTAGIALLSTSVITFCYITAIMPFTLNNLKVVENFSSRNDFEAPLDNATFNAMSQGLEPRHNVDYKKEVLLNSSPILKSVTAYRPIILFTQVQMNVTLS